MPLYSRILDISSTRNHITFVSASFIYPNILNFTSDNLWNIGTRMETEAGKARQGCTLSQWALVLYQALQEGEVHPYTNSLPILHHLQIEIQTHKNTYPRPPQLHTTMPFSKATATKHSLITWAMWESLSLQILTGLVNTCLVVSMVCWEMLMICSLPCWFVST